MSELMIRFFNKGYNLFQKKAFKILLVSLTIVVMAFSFFFNQIALTKLSYFLLGLSVSAIIFIRPKMD